MGEDSSSQITRNISGSPAASCPFATEHASITPIKTTPSSARDWLGGRRRSLVHGEKSTNHSLRRGYENSGDPVDDTTAGSISRTQYDDSRKVPIRPTVATSGVHSPLQPHARDRTTEHKRCTHSKGCLVSTLDEHCLRHEDFPPPRAHTAHSSKKKREYT